MNFGDGVVGAIIDWTVWVCTAGVAQRGEITAVEGNSLSLSAAPSRGSRVLRDSCSREIFSAAEFFSLPDYPSTTTKGSLAAAVSAACWLAPQARD